MKFNALVVAAMVITSVNAGWLKKGGGMTGSDSETSLLMENSESEPPQDSQRHGATQRWSWSSIGQSLGSVFSSKSSRNKPNTPQEPEATNVDPICNSIEDELCTLWFKINAFNIAFIDRILEFYALLAGGYKGVMERSETKGENGEENNSVMEMSEDEKRKNEEEKIKAHDLRAKEIQKWISLNPGAISDLESIKAGYISLENDYRAVWKRFDENNCETKLVKQFFIENMIKDGYFPKWDFEINLIDLRRK
ncbi:hypothetical protein BASA61_002456 [Batrachochytrium salamandrivorans]|nr:hypothetical protein BASA61_002456 [Batrachochytrium salamandrivorans]